MKRRKRLDDDLALDISAPGAARNLRQQLERPLARAKVRDVQALVRIDDADQRHIREVQALGDHLRSDEDVGFAKAEIAKDPTIVVLSLKRVGIHPLHARVGKKFRQDLLDLFSAEAGITDRRVTAFRLRTFHGTPLSYPQMWHINFCARR
jgi:hypothetical protein